MYDVQRHAGERLPAILGEVRQQSDQAAYGERDGGRLPILANDLQQRADRYVDAEQ